MQFKHVKQLGNISIYKRQERLAVSFGATELIA